MANKETDGSEAELGGLGRLFAAFVGEAAEASRSFDHEEPFSADRLVRRLIGSDNPLQILRDFTEREGSGEPSCALAGRLAERLTDAGILEDTPALPAVSVVRTRTSGLAYIRTEDAEIPYLAKLRVLGIEAALNSGLLCSALLTDPDETRLEDVVKAEQRVARSVVLSTDVPLSAIGGKPVLGEWEDRKAIATAIECLPLPYRLSARFRLNASEGAAAIEVDMTPPSLMPSRCYVDGIGVVAASASMRRRAATDYNLRVLILLAACALRCCEDLGRAYVAGVEDTATRHACYCSAVIERDDVDGIDLSKVEPVSFMRFICAQMDESAGELACVRQGFSLDEKRFCPPERFDVVELCDRPLAAERSRRRLGAARVSDLASNEAAAREQAARMAVSRLSESTEKNVRMLLGLGRELGREDVDAAARRVASALIAGTLDESDPEAVGEAIAGQGELADKVKSAHALLAKEGPKECASALAETLAPVQAQGLYQDRQGVAWRSFGKYTERAVFNRGLWDHETTIRLVPGAYVSCLHLLSTCDMMLGRNDAALEAAREAHRIAPVSTEVSLGLLNCLDASGRTQEALDLSRGMLARSVDPQEIGLIYITLAGIEYRGGHIRSSQACYQAARRFLPEQLVEAVHTLARLLGAAQGEGFSEERMADALKERGIPLAPTDEAVQVVYEIAEAAVDEGIFPVAREACAALVSFTRDDVNYGILRSLELEPDC